MKSFLTLILICLSYLSFSQQASPEIISSAGEHFENGELSLSWTLGETTISTLEGDIILSQGFHQDFFIITAIEEQKFENTSIRIFPNPTPDYLNIEWKANSESSEKMTIQLIDMQGKVLVEKTANTLSESLKLDLRSYKKSQYILQIKEGKAVKTYKIIKG